MAGAGTLKRWAAYATPEERGKLAEMSGTSEAYLFGQLANGHRKNPKLRLAMAIVIAAEKLNLRRKVKLPEITLKGIAWPS